MGKNAPGAPPRPGRATFTIIGGGSIVISIPGRIPAARVVLAAALMLESAGAPMAGSVDPLVQVSGPSLFADCMADLPQGGINFAGSEVEPWVAVNPVDPLNIVGTWQQDRWNNGGARGLAVGVSLDGGRTFRTVVVPGLTRCTGGTFLRASDPWLSFGPDGTLHHIALAFTSGPGGFNGILANRSTDGGLTWSPPVVLAANSPPFFHDKETITADPHDPLFVYAVWDRLDFSRNLGPALFARSRTGGATWEPPRILYDPGFGNQTVGNQIVVLPDGALMNFFTEAIGNRLFLSYRRSEDRGATWAPGAGAFRVMTLTGRGAIDPDRRRPVRDAAFLFDVAVDPRTGALYIVTQRGGFADGVPIDQVGFTRSIDGGLTWSALATINRTPAEAGPLERQAFIPSVHVSGNGTIGVSYYDFRFNDPAPGALTDHWFIWCHPLASDCARPSRWREELRMTGASFDMLQAPFAGGLFVGDYVGLASAGADFIALFSQPHDGDSASAFSRRVFLDDPVDPRGAGYWSHQVRAHLLGRGRAGVPESLLREYLEDIRALYDPFDRVDGLADLDAVLAPPPPPAMRALAERQVLALLLNQASLRVPPFTEIRPGETLTEVIDGLIAVLGDPSSSFRSLEAAKDLAEAINEGVLPAG